MSIKDRIRHFRNNDLKRTELATLLANPVFVEAVGLVLLDCYPAVSPNPSGAEETKTNLALSYAHRAGLGAFPSALESLALEPGEADGLALVPWGTLVPEKPKRRKAS